MNQKGFANIVLVVVIVILVGAVGYFAFVKKSEPIAQQPTPTPTQTTTSTKSPTPTTTPTATEKDVTNQPAYLIAAYSKNGKNYVDVDYVEWLHGDASLKAQVEDGKCVSLSECYDFPNGYKRNQNSLVRTFEVSPSVNIVVNGEISAEINKLENTQLPNPYGRNLSITFNKLKDAVSAMGTLKAFITIDVKGNVVTKISEPYQE